jgi:hypothetical protein
MTIVYGREGRREAERAYWG